ncbi:hypothetical protein D9M71_814360 [compost metagenome]
MIHRFHQVSAIQSALEALRLNHEFGKQIGAPRQIEAHRCGGTIERGQTRFGRFVGRRAVRVKVSIGVHWRHALRHVGVVQVRNL